MRFAASPENLATEALSFILQRSLIARKALLACLNQATGSAFEGEYVFRTQVVSNERAIPDLVGFDSSGVYKLIIEVKFWAGLIDN